LRILVNVYLQAIYNRSLTDCCRGYNLQFTIKSKLLLVAKNLWLVGSHGACKQNQLAVAFLKI